MAWICCKAWRMPRNGGSDGTRRGHSHHRSSAAVQDGTGEDEEVMGVTEETLTGEGAAGVTARAAASAACRRAASASGLKLVRMGHVPEGGGGGGQHPAANQRAVAGQHRAPAAV